MGKVMYLGFLSKQSERRSNGNNTGHELLQ